MTRTVAWLLVCCGVACSGAQETTPPRNNGHRGVLSLWTAGLPAEGHSFDVQLFRLEEDPDCAQPGCAREVPLTVETARCLDTTHCDLPTQDGRDVGGRAVLTVVANRMGVTSLEVRARTPAGEVLEDVFCVRVVRPATLEITCSGCVDGAIPTGQPAAGHTQVTCSLYNRAVSNLPLLGLCDASPSGPGLAVARESPDTLPPLLGPLAPGAVRGARFDVSPTSQRSGDVLWLHHRGLRVSLPSR